jgi:hypothetical protein
VIRLKLRQFRALAALTAVEVLREPISLLLMTGCVLLMALTSLQAYNFGEDGKFARDSALAVHFLFGTFIGGYAACNALSRELRSGTASVVLSKPVSRELFFLAKFAGIALVVSLFSACAMGATLLAEKASPTLWRMDASALQALLLSIGAAYIIAGALNYFVHRPFCSTAFLLMLVFVWTAVIVVACSFNPEGAQKLVMGHMVTIRRSMQWRILPVSLLVSFGLLVLTGIALALATRLRTLQVLLLCSAVLMLGLLSDYFFGRSADVSFIAKVLHGVIPNWQHFWLTDSLIADGRISAGYLGLSALYAGLHLTTALGIGSLLFRNMETR